MYAVLFINAKKTGETLKKTEQKKTLKNLNNFY